MTKILYAKDYVEKKSKELIEKVKSLKEEAIISTIRIGDDYGSLAYEKGIKKTAEKIGVQVDSNEFSKDSSEEEVIERIKKLNEDKKIGGILIFRPLPENFNEEKISLALDPKKDIDCMHPVNMAKVFSGDVSGFTPLAL